MFQRDISRLIADSIRPQDVTPHDASLDTVKRKCKIQIQPITDAVSSADKP